jgi:hypothetical protein
MTIPTPLCWSSEFDVDFWAAVFGDFWADIFGEESINYQQNV